ncbi:MAG: hypothetical protein KatS3mg088_731 [Patescibacteria group bacterium]|nr:MAG: hypothetical protein KatS3mg088_731 [Patescibacteria group bacterium]
MSIELIKNGLEAGGRSSEISNWAIDVLNSIENEKQGGEKRGDLSRIKPFLRGLAGLPKEDQDAESKRSTKSERSSYLHEVYTKEEIDYLLGRRIGRALESFNKSKSNIVDGKKIKLTVGVVGIEGMNGKPWGDNPDDKRHLGEIEGIIRVDYKKGVSRILNLLLSSYQQERKVDPQALSRELCNLQRAVNKIVSHREKLSTEGGRGIAHFAIPEEEKDGKRNPRRVLLAASVVSSVLSGCVPLSQPPAIVEKSTTIYQNQSQEASSAVVTPDITTVTPTVTIEIPTPIPTLTPTPRPTETPTPTEVPLEVFYNFSGIESGNWRLGEHLKEIPTISLEDITSGRLLKRERQLMEEGKIPPFTESTIPPNLMDYYDYSFIEGIHALLPDPVTGDPIISDYFLDHPEAVPFRLLSLSFVDVDSETRLLVYGVAFLNPDKSISILHFAFENYEDPFVLNMVSALANFKVRIDPLIGVSPAYNGKTYNWYDYNRYEGYMINTHYRNEEEVQKRRTLCQQWFNENKAPEELGNQLLLAFISPWNPFRQRDIKPKN